MGRVDWSVGWVGGQDDHVITQVGLLWLVYALCAYMYKYSRRYDKASYDYYIVCCVYFRKKQAIES